MPLRSACRKTIVEEKETLRDAGGEHEGAAPASGWIECPQRTAVQSVARQAGDFQNVAHFENRDISRLSKKAGRPFSTA